jgi:peptidyl-prolyl cis-trans isomerase-like 4
MDYFKIQIFGVVAEGEDVLMRINEAYVDEKFRPFKNIRYACVLRDDYVHV